MTVKLLVVVAVCPPAVTEIGPSVAPAGTVAVIEVSEATLKLVAAVVPNVTELAPVKPLPVIVTDDPTGPLVGENELMTGVTENAVVVVAVPPEVVTAITPLPPAGAAAVIWLPSELTANDDAALPLNVTEVAPVKPEPVIVTEVPTGPLVGVNELIVGAACCEPLQEGNVNDPIRVCQLSCNSVAG